MPRPRGLRLLPSCGAATLDSTQDTTQARAELHNDYTIMTPELVAEALREQFFVGR